MGWGKGRGRGIGVGVLNWYLSVTFFRARPVSRAG